MFADLVFNTIIKTETRGCLSLHGIFNVQVTSKMLCSRESKYLGLLKVTITLCIDLERFSSTKSSI